MAASQTLAGKTIAVTGAESGIGRAIAQECAAQGARLCLIGLDAAGLAETAAQIVAAGGTQAVVAPADITDEARMSALFAGLAADGGCTALPPMRGSRSPSRPRWIWTWPFGAVFWR